MNIQKNIKQGDLVKVSNGAYRVIGIFDTIEKTYPDGTMAIRVHAPVPWEYDKVWTAHYGTGKYPYELKETYIDKVEILVRLTKKEDYKAYINSCKRISIYNKDAQYPKF